METMETYLEKKWLLGSYRNSLLLELKTINSKIEEADSPPSQSNFEILRDSLLLAVEIIKSGSRDDYWIFIELWHSLSLVLATISEVDSPPLQLIIERLQSCPFFKEAISLRKSKYPPSQLFLDRPSHVTQKNKLYLYFSCSYALFEIELPYSLRHPPTKATQDAEIRNPSPLKPILQLETSKYPDGMCCVQLRHELYFFGGKFMNRTRNVLPKDVYVFNLTLYHKCPDLLRRMKDMLLPRTPMHSGKASPLAFVADAKIYVIGSNLEDLEDERLFYFEFYDPCCDQWSVLPNPPIRGRWVGNAVVGRVAFLVGMRLGRRYVYRFNLDTKQWTYKVSVLDSHLRNFTGKTEFVGNNLYGCYHNRVVKLAVTEEELTEIDLGCQSKEEEEGGEEEEWGKEEEEDEFQLVARLIAYHNRFRMITTGEREGEEEDEFQLVARLIAYHHRFPRQLQSSTTLLHLGRRYFCYVRTGKPPQIHEDGVDDDDDIPSNRDRFISIVIFQTATRETYAESIWKLLRLF
nr:hypothetical protein CFP56_78780 [Quercus suber]